MPPWPMRHRLPPLFFSLRCSTRGLGSLFFSSLSVATLERSLNKLSCCIKFPRKGFLPLLDVFRCRVTFKYHMGGKIDSNSIRTVEI